MEFSPVIATLHPVGSSTAQMIVLNLAFQDNFGECAPALRAHPLFGRPRRRRVGGGRPSFAI